MDGINTVQGLLSLFELQIFQRISSSQKHALIMSFSSGFDKSQRGFTGLLAARDVKSNLGISARIIKQSDHPIQTQQFDASVQTPQLQKYLRPVRKRTSDVATCIAKKIKQISENSELRYKVFAVCFIQRLDTLDHKNNTRKFHGKSNVHHGFRAARHRS